MLSVFVPAYNESRMLERSVASIIKSLSDTDFELFIVDDASTDDTGKIAQGLAEADPRIRHVRYDEGPTRRENLARSFHLARGEHVVFIDSDLSVGPENIMVLVGALSRADIAISSRYHPRSVRHRGIFRDAWSLLANWLIRNYLGSRLFDHQCGLKAFQRDALMSLVEEAGFDTTGQRGFGWDTEVLVRAQRRGLKIEEIPVVWEESGKSSVEVMRDWRIVSYMVGLRSRMLR